MEHPAETLAYGQVVLLRRRPADLEVLDRLVLESLDHLRPWMPWATGNDRQQVLEHLLRVEREWETGEAYTYGITVAGRPVGSCSLMRRTGPGGLELGYWLHPGWTGRGLATMAAAALIGAAFALPGVDFVEIRHDEANRASAAVPGRLGFTVVSREPDPGRGGAPAESGVTVVQRLRRPR